MDKPTRVAIHGCSLNMAAIAASLRADPGMEVRCINHKSPLARECLEEFNPSALVFDMADASIRLDATLLRRPSGTLLIGIDLESDELLVLSCQTSKALSVTDLINVIRTNALHTMQPATCFDPGHKDAASRAPQ